MIEGNFDLWRTGGVDRGDRGIVAFFLDAKLARSFWNVQEFADSGNPRLTPESERRQWRLEDNASGGDRNSIFIEHDDGEALRSLRPPREHREEGNRENQEWASAHTGMRSIVSQVDEECSSKRPST